MDLKLTEEEQLIKKTAAEFVDKELIAREGAYLKQTEPFLPSGAPVRREVDVAIRAELVQKARAIGLWCLELPEAFGGTAMTMVMRVLIHREFGRSILPFAPVAIPLFMFETKYGQRLANGELALSFAFDEAHAHGSLNQLHTLYRQEPEGGILQESPTDGFEPHADVFLFPAREQGTQRLGLFAVERDAPGVPLADEVDLTTDSTVARCSMHCSRIPKQH